ncbi:hypothetical protein L3X38_002181 [Prunus dulcis]|uniref:Uncharacterized protein n=1 Tax=Prunus dulcis TaxID=3755 RepID=A0AAD4WV09_PRUDU|nr:hypothetical protein L3X38_002181 [Prunus dulcis]
MSLEICEKTATLELSEKRIKECETELEQQRGELRNLISSQSTIRVEVAKKFRYGWVQSQQQPEHWFLAGPDDYDNELESDPDGYELFLGMHPDDSPPTGYIPHHRTTLAAFHPSKSVGTVVSSANVTSSIPSTWPVLVFTGFTSSAGFSTCVGPTSETILDPLDDAS